MRLHHGRGAAPAEALPYGILEVDLAGRILPSSPSQGTRRGLCPEFQAAFANALDCALHFQVPHRTDDLTRDAVARALGRPLVPDPSILARIEARRGAIPRHHLESCLQQVSGHRRAHDPEADHADQSRFVLNLFRESVRGTHVANFL